MIRSKSCRFSESAECSGVTVTAETVSESNRNAPNRGIVSGKLGNFEEVRGWGKGVKVFEWGGTCFDTIHYSIRCP